MQNVRYNPLPSTTRLPRDELAPGRRLSSGGRLSGALHTLGYYSTDVCLGTPGRRFDLIIDTGSSITAVPCSTCKQCGTHRCGRTGRYDPLGSPTSSSVSCHRPAAGFSCEKCSGGDQCAYSVHYTEGSAISGHVVNDYAHFLGDRPDGSGVTEVTSTRVYFGCQTLETGMFHRQQADGIMGLQPPRARGRFPSFLTTLVQQGKATGEAFSLCLSDRSGLFLLGGRTDRAQLRGRAALTLPMDRGARARYTLGLREILVSGSNRQNGTYKSLRLPPSVYAPTLVDSGTTFVYASTPLYSALHAHLRSEQPLLQREGGKVCAFLTEAQLASMPNLRFVFTSSATPLLVRPQQYMVEFPKAAKPGTRHLCPAIFDNQRAGTVIGASIMRHREVIFDLASSSITFVDADCTRSSAKSSAMQGAYAFAPCPQGNVSAGSTPPPVRSWVANAMHRGATALRSWTGGPSMSTARATSARPGGGGGGHDAKALTMRAGRQKLRRALSRSSKAGHEDYE